MPVLQRFLLSLLLPDFLLPFQLQCLPTHGQLLGSFLMWTLLASFACILLLFKSITLAYGHIQDRYFDDALITALVWVMVTNRSYSDLLPELLPHCQLCLYSYCLQAQAALPVSCSSLMTESDNQNMIVNFVCQLK